MSDLTLAERIYAEAEQASRAGQYGRLADLADEVGDLLHVLDRVRALVDEWAAWAQSDLRDDKATGSHPGSYWRGRHDGTRDCADDLRAALDTPVSASQDHDGAEGQGEGVACRSCNDAGYLRGGQHDGEDCPACTDEDQR